MTREAKIGMLTGLGVIVLIGVLLSEYLGGDRTAFELPTATGGDPFQERVWALLREIPRGETTTYGALAEQRFRAALVQELPEIRGLLPGRQRQRPRMTRAPVCAWNSRAVALTSSSNASGRPAGSRIATLTETL